MFLTNSDDHLHVRCSTPFGIRENGTRRRPSRQRDTQPCAQRLSASERPAPVLGAGQEGLVLVCSTPFGIRETGTGFPLRNHPVTCVLNAFRHQRDRHNRRTTCFTSRRACSTPFGIRETGTSSLPLFFLLFQVLNAFRHQRDRHCTHPICLSSHNLEDDTSSSRPLLASPTAISALFSWPYLQCPQRTAFPIRRLHFASPHSSIKSTHNGEQVTDKKSLAPLQPS